SRRAVSQFAAQYGQRRAAQIDAVATYAYPDIAAACRGLVAGQCRALEPVRPERAECSVRGAGHRILIHADAWREEARYEIAARAVAQRGDDDSARFHATDSIELRLKCPDQPRGAELDPQVAAVDADLLRVRLHR